MPADGAIGTAIHATATGIYATDGDIGHIEDFVMDDEGWGIRYLVPPHAARDIRWAERHVDLDRAPLRPSHRQPTVDVNRYD